MPVALAFHVSFVSFEQTPPRWLFLAPPGGSGVRVKPRRNDSPFLETERVLPRLQLSINLALSPFPGSLGQDS